ncbi:hypothetical protein ACFX2I_001603 [Malus domestica]
MGDNHLVSNNHSNSSNVSCIAVPHNQSIVDFTDFDYFPNVKIVVNADQEVPVHRCVLSARSEFFKNVFSVKDRGSSAAVTS